MSAFTELNLEMNHLYNKVIEIKKRLSEYSKQELSKVKISELVNKPYMFHDFSKKRNCVDVEVQHFDDSERHYNLLVSDNNISSVIEGAYLVSGTEAIELLGYPENVSQDIFIDFIGRREYQRFFHNGQMLVLFNLSENSGAELTRKALKQVYIFRMNEIPYEFS